LDLSIHTDNYSHEQKIIPNESWSKARKYTVHITHKKYYCTLHTIQMTNKPNDRKTYCSILNK